MEGNKEAYNLMQSIALGKSDRKFVLLYGVAGCGKTHLIEATIIEWSKKSIMSRYSTLSQMMRRLKTSLGKSEVYEEAFKNTCETARLIIDDVGMGSIESKWEIAELEDIVNERYHKRYFNDGKITIIATNKNISELPDRIVSRFYDPEFGKVLLMESGDYRKRKI